MRTVLPENGRAVARTVPEPRNRNPLPQKNPPQPSGGQLGEAERVDQMFLKSMNS